MTSHIQHISEEAQAAYLEIKFCLADGTEETYLRCFCEDLKIETLGRVSTGVYQLLIQAGPLRPIPDWPDGTVRVIQLKPEKMLEQDLEHYNVTPIWVNAKAKGPEEGKADDPVVHLICDEQYQIAFCGLDLSNPRRHGYAMNPEHASCPECLRRYPRIGRADHG